MQFIIEFDIENDENLKEVKRLKLQNEALSKAYSAEQDEDLKNALRTVQDNIQNELNKALIKAAKGIMDDYFEGLQDFIYTEV